MESNDKAVKIKVEKLRKCFGDLEVLRDISTEIHEGEVVVILGPSGSGKSTFLRCLNTLETATAGSIVVDGVDISDKKVNMNKVRENIGMVFQHFNLFNNMDVIHNLMLAPMELKKEIRMEDVSYTYPESDKVILDHAQMLVPVGKSVGVMGPSGAGKSTAIDILMGLLQVQGGEILCDGRNIFENYPSWLSHIGYIPQTIYLTDDSIRENIAFGVAKEDIDDERVWHVLEEAQLKDFVKELPGMLDMEIGERGVRLSGGQRQRLGIARALYHNPEILVFDEATSALDTDTETAIMEAIESFHGKKTLVIIAHRLRTIAGCDIIYKVDNGKIVETTLAAEEH